MGFKFKIPVSEPGVRSMVHNAPTTRIPSLKKLLFNDEAACISREENHCDVQNYCVFGLFPSSNILENREHNFSETGSVSILVGDN